MRNTDAPVKKLAATVAAFIAAGAALTALAPTEATAHPRTTIAAAAQATDATTHDADTNPWT